MVKIDKNSLRTLANQYHTMTTFLKEIDLNIKRCREDFEDYVRLKLIIRYSFFITIY